VYYFHEDFHVLLIHDSVEILPWFNYYFIFWFNFKTNLNL